jgi:hypothetical protein
MPTTIANAPYDRDGNLIHHPDGELDYTNAVIDPEFNWRWKVPPVSRASDWRPNTPFHAKLTFAERRATSNPYTVWTDDHGREYPMNFQHLLAIIRAGHTIADATIDGTWMVAKLGPTYGVRIATPAEIAAAARASKAN